MQSPRIQRALLSVSDRLGLADFARGLVEAGIEIYSTGGTQRYLEQQQVPARNLSDYTGFPEVLGGRVKTLHPMVFAGILARRDRIEDMETLDELSIVPFELVVVNLYPFEATIQRPSVSEEEAIEQIDIGGPSLIRAAAKNFRFVTVATAPEQYSGILEEIRRDGCTSLALRLRLAVEAFERTAEYDRTIAAYFRQKVSVHPFPSVHTLVLRKKMDLRYGENPHQAAALYYEVGTKGPSLVSARQLHGKELSYNNFLDLDAGIHIVRTLPQPACAVIKHTNPCGAAMAESLVEATQRALEGDPQSAFGCVLAVNRTLDAATAELLARPGWFVEAVIAPDYEAAALGILTTRPKWKDNVRLMQLGSLEEIRLGRQYRHILGGMLVQEPDTLPDIPSQWQQVTRQQVPAELLPELEFAWCLVRHVKSNAIVVCKQHTLVGCGAGQMSRVDAVEIALGKAGPRAAGAVLASDAFFPFPDSIEKAAQAGIAAIVQPGGSRRDDEVIAACDRLGIPMLFTGRRHFKH